MTVDIRLNQMIDALDGRMKSIMVEDVELSVRTLKALKDCGVRTLHEAQMAIINRQLHKQHGIGPKAVKEVEEIIFNVSSTLPVVGTTHLSCGHQADPCCSGVDVTFEDEDCVAGEGFKPVTVFAIYCHKCAMEQAAAEERAKIVAWLRGNAMSDRWSALATAIEAGEYRNG